MNDLDKVYVQVRGGLLQQDRAELEKLLNKGVFIYEDWKTLADRMDDLGLVHAAQDVNKRAEHYNEMRCVMGERKRVTRLSWEFNTNEVVIERGDWRNTRFYKNISLSSRTRINKIMVDGFRYDGDWVVIDDVRAGLAGRGVAA